MIADGSAKGKVDPAFQAHDCPLGYWAKAVWNGWLPEGMLARMMERASKTLKHAARPWAKVYGPGAGAWATAARLGWTFADAFRINTDDGKEIDIREDPPKVVVQLCSDAVRRWKWKRIEAEMPHLRTTVEGSGARFQPIFKLLASNASWPDWAPPKEEG